MSGGLKRARDFISTELQIPVGRGRLQLMINAEGAYKEQTLDDSLIHGGLLARQKQSSELQELEGIDQILMIGAV